jgi:predicted small lipoprotein YifL
MRASRGVVSLVVALAAALTLAGCSPSGPVEFTGHTSVADPVKPLPTDGKFDYQLGGGYTPPSGVTIVTRDSTDTPAAGLYNICYINGFQTQDYLKSWWLKHHPTLVLRGKNKKPITDAGWPGEMILNSSTAAKRKSIAAVQAKTIATCASKGFDAVEFDNLDSYSRSKGKLTKSDNVALAKLLVASSHKDGLAAGQKNAVELSKTAHSTDHFDFAMAEECYRYNECAGYTDVYGSQVLDVEYTNDLRGTFASDCASTDRPAIMILRDVDLTTPTDKAYAYQSC